MGVLDLKIQNEALLLKYLDKFYNKVDTPWVNLIWNTYYTNKVPHAVEDCGSFWWKAILKLAPIYRGIAQCNIVSSASILMWKDPCSDDLASDSFPRAYSFSLNEDVSAFDFLTAGSLAENFALPISTQALDELRELQQLVAHIEIDPQGKDTWTYVWGADKFVAKRYYQFCFRKIQPHVTFSWLWKTSCVPKIKFFCWLLLCDRLNKKDMLKRRHFNINGTSQCLMCNTSS